MKQNTFEPCKDHENGHFNWCLLCEIEQLREAYKRLDKDYFRAINLSWQFEKVCPPDKWKEITDKYADSIL